MEYRSDPELNLDENSFLILIFIPFLYIYKCISRFLYMPKGADI